MFSATSRNLMLLACVGALLAHVYLLHDTGLDWIESPVSQLSQNGRWLTHGLTLTLFGLSQAIMAWHVAYPEAGGLTRCIQVLSILNAGLLVSLTYVFTLPESAVHTAMLSLIASFTGVIMACLIAIDAARDELSKAIVQSGYLLIWLALIPVYLLIDIDLVGAYERSVGAVYCLWLFTVATRKKSSG